MPSSDYDGPVELAKLCRGPRGHGLFILVHALLRQGVVTMDDLRDAQGEAQADWEAAQAQIEVEAEISRQEAY